jgi:hypothetical protein
MCGASWAASTAPPRRCWARAPRVTRVLSVTASVSGDVVPVSAEVETVAGLSVSVAPTV